MTQVGEIKRGREIGMKLKSSKFLWHACVDCRKPRWVRIIKGQPQYSYCQSCGNKRVARRGANNGWWKGGRCKLPTGYIVILLQPDDFFFPMVDNRHYVPEHRLVMAKHLGRNLHRWEIVHHKNGIKDDNLIDNLQLVTDDRHKQISVLEKRITYLELKLQHNNIPF